MPTPKKIQRLSFEKAKDLESLITAVEKRIASSSADLTKIILNRFLKVLKTRRGRLIAKLDKTTLTLYNKAFNVYAEGKNQILINTILSDVNTIRMDNHAFYENTVKGFALSESEIKSIINRRLGINPDGGLRSGGYMEGILSTASLKSEIQKFIFKEIFKGTGYEDLKNNLSTFIEGNRDTYGVLQRHYKTFTYDAYAQLNGYTAGLYSEKLGLSHFIYNGGLIETSRKFCIKRNGKVFSTEEAEKWEEDSTLTAIDDSTTYNWLIDRGGYNCRHSIDFIADEVAYVLRPELKKAR